jgi:hypothetical protein
MAKSSLELKTGVLLEAEKTCSVSFPKCLKITIACISIPLSLVVLALRRRPHIRHDAKNTESFKESEFKAFKFEVLNDVRLPSQLKTTLPPVRTLHNCAVHPSYYGGSND